jgi:NADH-quinone oxidoreductase subunit G
MPKCTINGTEIEVAPGTTVMEAADSLGIHIPHFCYHKDLPVDGNCRMCLVEIEKMPKLQIACNTVVSDGMVVRTDSEKAKEAHRTTLELLLSNHPIDCPVCDQAGECYLQDQYMEHGLHDSRVELEEKIHKRKVVDLGPIMLDAERCVLCSRCLRFEREVTGTNSLEFRNRGGTTQIASFEDRPIAHHYAGNLADVCPVGALLSHDFRFKMRVWFLESTPSVCPGCSTGCNIFVDHRDGVPYRLRPRRNAEVNRSWTCDPGRSLYRDLTHPSRIAAALARSSAASPLEEVALEAALDRVASALREAGPHSAFIASPQASNEELYAFRLLAEACGGRLDFRVGNPEARVRVREDEVLQRLDKNPNTQGCLDLELGRSGLEEILTACRDGAVDVLLLQGPELLRQKGTGEALAKVGLVAVMATHSGPELERAEVVLPTAMWAETDGTFTNYARRLQRFRRAFAAPGDARSRLELVAGLADRLERPILGSARELFVELAAAVPDYQGLSHQSLGAAGRALPLEPAPEPALKPRS